MMAKLRNAKAHRERCTAIRMDRFELSIQENSTKRDQTKLKKKTKKQNEV